MMESGDSHLSDNLSMIELDLQIEFSLYNHR
jgi:hypothetical protein